MTRFFRNRTIVKGFMALSALTMLVSSCDNVSEDNRLIDYPLPEASKNLLIFEFTGQNCVNCPNGAAVIKDLQTEYGESVIAVCLHPENLEFTELVGKVDLGLRSQLATDVYKSFTTSTFPYAIFDGKVLPQSSFFLQWAEAATKMVQADTPAVVEAEAGYDSNRNITVNAKVNFLRGEYQRPLNIAVWIMENGIVGPQQSSSGRLKEYVHNHVARASLNGTWGANLGSAFELGYEHEYSVSMTDTPADWKLENCVAVVFLVDPDSKAVIQATEVELEESL